MAKTKETQGAAAEVAAEAQPQKGGSFTRKPDGSLQRDDGNSTSQFEMRAATYPKDKAKGE